MILDRPLSPDESRTSLRRLALYNLTNGFSFAGVGETVMVLVAVRLGCPDAVSSTFGGTLFYAGFAAMPLGRLAAARWGAARSGGAFWALRNLFALLVPAAALWGPRHPTLVAATVLLGAAGFYACRSAGVVLYGPLVGESAPPEERAGALGRMNSLFYVGLGLGLPAALLALRGADSIGRLAAVVAVGAALGVWSAAYLFRTHETSALREGARHPIRADLRELAAHRAFRRLVAGAASANLLYALVVPASVVILKRGYGATDMQAVAYSAALLVGAGLSAWANGPLARRIGPRMELVAAHALLLAAAAAWVLLPNASAAAPAFALAAAWVALFFALGISKALCENAMLHYAVSCVAPRLVVSATTALYLATGLVAGVAGLALSAILLGHAAAGGATDAPGPAALAAYRGYFLAVICLLLPLGALVWRILPLRAAGRAPAKTAGRAPDGSFRAFSLVTRDGRRLVRRGEGAEAVWALVPEAELPPGTPPPRRWTVYGVKSAHSDLGLHRSPAVQRRNAVLRLDRVRELAAADARPDGDPAAFRWVAEGWWSFLGYPAARDAAAVRDLLALHRRGRFDVGGNWCGSTTHAMGFEELCRSLYAKREMEEAWGVRTKTAQIADNPGISCALVGLLADAGVRYLTHWPNAYAMGLDGRTLFADATSPDRPCVFWWEAPDGRSRVLVWTNERAYIGGGEFGLGTAFIDPPSHPFPEKAPTVPADWRPDLGKWERTTAERLAALEAAVPYDTWLFPDYHDDEVPSTRLADAFAAWNEKWATPVFRTVGSLDEPFERLERRWGARIPVLRGDLPCAWDRATPAFADFLARKFAADRALPVAEARAAVASATTGAPYPRDRFERGYAALVSFDDHSYGFSGYSGRRVYDTWDQRRAWLEEAEQAACGGASPPGEPPRLGGDASPHRSGACADLAISGGASPPGEPQILENRWYRVSVRPDGAILSIFDKELGRELLAAPANELFYTRDRYASWSDPAALRASRIASSVRLADDRKAILIENVVEGAADLVEGERQKRYGHYAFPFALENPRFAAQLGGPVADPFRDALPQVANSYACIRDWCAVEDGACGIALVQPDTWAMEFGRQHGAEAYGRETGPASAAMWSIAFADGLRWHWTEPPSFRFRYVVTSYAGDWRSARIPAFAAREVGSLAADADVARRVSCDAPNAELVALKAADDGRGFVARFRETDGRAVRATVRQNLVPGARLVLADLLERPRAELPGGALELAPFAFATVRIEPPSR